MIIIRLEGIHNNGAYYSVEYSDKKGQKEYYYGEKSVLDFINSTTESIEIEKCRGYDEHSDLIDLIRSRQLKQEKGEPKNENKQKIL